MLVFGLDFETTGLDPKKDRVVEVGGVLWDTDTGSPINIISEFCYEESFETLMDEEAEKAHGLSIEFLRCFGRPPDQVFADLIPDVCTAIIAHNAPFDRGFYEMECARTNQGMLARPWIDTACDIKYPQHISTRKLSYLAAEHSFLNPFPHRAVFDVMTMLIVFQNYDPEAALARSKEPDVTLQALVGYDDRHKAKDCGFHWNKDNKRWEKKMKLSDVAEESFKAQEQGFAVKELKPKAQQMEIV